MSSTIIKDELNMDTFLNEYSINQDGVVFDNVIGNGVTIGGKIVHPGSLTSGESTNVIPAINAVDIDWNNAKLGETIIATTGQLLSYLTSISEKVNAIEHALLNL